MLDRRTNQPTKNRDKTPFLLSTVVPLSIMRLVISQSNSQPVLVPIPFVMSLTLTPLSMGIECETPSTRAYTIPPTIFF